MTFLAELVAIFVLRKYIVFSVVGYLMNVYMRCFVVAAVSTILPWIVHEHMPEGFLRLVVVTAVSVVCVAITVFLIGIDNQTRKSAIATIRAKLKR